ncbi:MAG TPA: hypothetical protein VFR81_25145, partial [Longimicrobium sp.]|nr:hypothetical protein [Longimicrobium sp.]
MDEVVVIVFCPRGCADEVRRALSEPASAGLAHRVDAVYVKDEARAPGDARRPSPVRPGDL